MPSISSRHAARAAIPRRSVVQRDHLVEAAGPYCPYHLDAAAAQRATSRSSALMTWSLAVSCAVAVAACAYQTLVIRQSHQQFRIGMPI